MTINKKPGNQPDPGDMAGTFPDQGATGGAAAAHPVPSDEDADDEAARLGDFA